VCLRARLRTAEGLALCFVWDVQLTESNFDLRSHLILNVVQQAKCCAEQVGLHILRTGDVAGGKIFLPNIEVSLKTESLRDSETK